ncbi:MAG: hypothetical protein HYX89_00230, partial [Chloroflexi bacterium]|nr:hypothetical protein [Chloroflexota bacterium]
GWVTPTDWQEDPAQPVLAIVADVGDLLNRNQVAVVFEMGASAVVQKLTPESGPIPLIAPEPPIAEVPARFPALMVLGNELRFLGNDLSTTSVRPGDSLSFSLYWEALRPPPRNYQVSVHLVDEEGRSWALDDGELMDRQRVGEVQSGQMLYYTRAFTVPDGTPVGRYRLVVTVYPIGQRGPLQMPLVAFDLIAGRPGPIALGPIKVGPKQPLVADQLSPQYKVHFTLGDEITLLGYDRSGGIRGGQPLALVLYWQALQRPKEDYTVFVHVLDDKGAVVLQQDQYPVGNRYPTSLWDAGEMVADTYVFSLPQQLAHGRYAIEVGMYRLATLQRLPVLGAQGPLAENRIMLEPLVVE